MATKKAALGRGLDALISIDRPIDGTSGEESTGSKMYDFEDRLRLVGRVAEIEVERIKPNPYQPRDSFDEAGLEELATSIKQVGIVQPITVRAVGGGRFELISGERRLRAAKLAGLARIPSYVRQADTEEMLEMAIVENIQREELNPIEIAHGYERLIDECGLTQEQVSDKVGKSRVAVTNTLRLLRLPAYIQSLIKLGSLTAGHARAVVTIEDEPLQRKIVEVAVREGLSVREVERRVRSLLKPREKTTAPTQKAANRGVDPNMRAVTDRLRSRFSTQVQIRPHGSDDSGRIEISYYSREDLERLIEELLLS
ncbi:MAG: ParB/RepB/Spo0J family partition protein [Rhodothermales bacterium]|nr:ParB/RepB/Spo0J family partition protein [Rhodothermales bacterium]